jgi:hypothetical protein
LFIYSYIQPVGRLPETTPEQLERFMGLYNKLEAAQAKIKRLQQIRAVLVAR